MRARVILLCLSLIMAGASPTVANSEMLESLTEILGDNTPGTTDAAYDILKMDVPYGCYRAWAEMAALNFLMAELSNPQIENAIAFNTITAQEDIMDWTQETTVEAATCGFE